MADYPELGLDMNEAMLQIVPTGSYFNCSPPVTSTDRDYLILSYFNIEAKLIEAGYVQTDSDPTKPKSTTNSIPAAKNGKDSLLFTSWRRGNINIILTRDTDHFNKHKIAGYVCKRLNLMKKEDRIMIYDAIMAGVYQQPEPTFKKKEIDYLAINRGFC